MTSFFTDKFDEIVAAFIRPPKKTYKMDRLGKIFISLSKF